MTLFEFLKNRMGSCFSDETEFPVPLSLQSFSKGTIITDYGQIERRLYFINKGLVQLTMLHEGEEKIIDFFGSDSFVCAYTSFLRQAPSDIQITTLVESEMEVINYSDLQNAYRTSILANKLGRLFTEQIYIVKTTREKDFLTKSAQERYKELITTRPEIAKLVPVNKIAKYLGIHPESLSRIRKSFIS